jgi:hypothetical protein
MRSLTERELSRTMLRQASFFLSRRGRWVGNGMSPKTFLSECHSVMIAVDVPQDFR